MGGKASASSHMKGSNAFNRTNDNLLEQDKIERHLKEINAENDRIAAENERKANRNVIDTRRHPLIENAPAPAAPNTAQPRSIKDVFGELGGYFENGRGVGKINKYSLNMGFPELKTKPSGIRKKDRIEEVFDEPPSTNPSLVYHLITILAPLFRKYGSNPNFLFILLSDGSQYLPIIS